MTAASGKATGGGYTYTDIVGQMKAKYTAKLQRQVPIATIMIRVRAGVGYY